MTRLSYLLIGILLFSCKVTKDNPTLKELAEQDQKERTENNIHYSANDIGRYKALNQLLQKETLKTSNDYLNAGIIFQHGNTSEDYLKANEFAKKAVRLNKKNNAAKTLIAQSWDRYLRSLGKPQVYGTQRFIFRNIEYLEAIDTTVISEKERRQLGISTLADKLTYFNNLYNKTEHSVFAYVISDTAKKRLLQEEPVQIVGGIESIAKQIKYPQAALDNKINGKVLLEFVVDANGKPKNIVVAQGLGFGCDEEAIRVLQLGKFINNIGEDSEMRIRIPFKLP
jgi:TonB family protein